MKPCERKCYDCGNVAMHEDVIVPWVLCKKCGSQDTRRVKPSEAAMKIVEDRDNAEVGALLAKCDYFEVDCHPEGWAARVTIGGSIRMRSGEGPTQLAAIRAAVEAAE